MTREMVSQPHGGRIVRARKGEVLNPNGRPKGALNFRTVIARFFEEGANEEIIQSLKADGHLNNQEAIVLQQVRAATLGDLDAAKWLADRYEPPLKAQDERPDNSVNLSLSIDQLTDLTGAWNKLQAQQNKTIDVTSVEEKEELAPIPINFEEPISAKSSGIASDVSIASGHPKSPVP